jgi:hypothetical protein
MAWNPLLRRTTHLLATARTVDLTSAANTDQIVTDGYYLASATITLTGLVGTSGLFRLLSGNDGVLGAEIGVTAALTADGTYTIELADNVHMGKFIWTRWIPTAITAGAADINLYMRRRSR